MFHDHLDGFQKPPLEGRPNTKSGDHGTPNAHKCWFILFYHVGGPSRIKKFIEIAFDWGPGHLWLHTTLEGRWPHCMALEVCWDGLGTLSFGLSQFHGHGNWLVCEVALCPRSLLALANCTSSAFRLPLFQFRAAKLQVEWDDYCWTSLKETFWSHNWLWMSHAHHHLP